MNRTWSAATILPWLNTLTGAGNLLTDPQIMTNPYVLTASDTCARNLSTIDHIDSVRLENFYLVTAILQRPSMTFPVNTFATSIVNGLNCHLCSHWQRQMCQCKPNNPPVITTH